ncbi:MAG: TlpA family protein disulfide reductase [Chloroflexi bacterium]|nr:TlpA family protein disulfide reductase [Chloroflexota bacterium]
MMEVLCVHRRVVLIFVLLILGALGMWLAFQMAARNAPPRVGNPIPDFTLESTDGEKISLAAQRGKAVVVVFVASWCKVCREEMPMMAETFRAHREHDVVFLGVDIYEDYLVAKKIHHEFDMPFPFLVDAYGEVTTRFRVKGTPTTFFIDRNGILRDVVVGGPLDRGYLDKEIAPLLGITSRKVKIASKPSLSVVLTSLSFW